MKVGTDGVLLGAWADVSGVERILDIGSGSGLIALMLAQRSEAKIDAIEIDENAFLQNEENFAQSKWKESLNVQHISLADFTKKENYGRYDLIVCNPPFFQNALKSPMEDRTLARHSVALTLKQLLDCSEKLLNNSGNLCLILPLEKLDEVKHEIAGKMTNKKQMLVFPKPGKAAKRVLLQLQKGKCETEFAELTIETGSRHEYSSQFKELLKDFYLAF